MHWLTTVRRRNFFKIGFKDDRLTQADDIRANNFKWCLRIVTLLKIIGNLMRFFDQRFFQVFHPIFFMTPMLLNWEYFWLLNLCWECSVAKDEDNCPVVMCVKCETKESFAKRLRVSMWKKWNIPCIQLPHLSD